MPTIDIHASILKQNIENIISHAPQKKIWLVCKARSYGLGLEIIEFMASGINLRLMSLIEFSGSQIRQKRKCKSISIN